MNGDVDALVVWLRAQLDDDADVLDLENVALNGIESTAGYAVRQYVERGRAEVDAKRRILDAAAEYSPELEHGDNGEWALDLVLRLLALPYADRAGYRYEWGPDV